MSRLAFVVIMLASTAALADRSVVVHVSFMRTITETTTDVGIVPATCNTTIAGSWSFNETVSYAADHFPLVDDGDSVQVTAPDDNAKMTGTGSWDWRLDSKTTGCHQDESANLQAHADLDANDPHFGLDFHRKSLQGQVAVSPKFKQPAGSGKIVNQGTAIDATAIATSQAATVAAGFGNLELKTAASWAVMGPAMKQMQQTMELSAQDAAVTISTSTKGFEVGYDITRTRSLDQTTSARKITGKHIVTTRVKVSISPAPH